MNNEKKQTIIITSVYNGVIVKTKDSSGNLTTNVFQNPGEMNNFLNNILFPKISICKYHI